MTSIILFFILLVSATIFFFIAIQQKYSLRKAALIFQTVISFYTTLFCLYLTFDLYNSANFSFTKEFFFGLRFNLEPIGVVFLNMVSFLWFLTSLYSIGYVNIKSKINANRFSFFTIGSIVSALMLAISGDLITSFIFYEMLTIMTVPLIIATGSQKEIAAARKYIFTLFAYSLCLFLPAIIIIYYFTGGAGFAVSGILKSSGIASSIAIIVFLMFMYGIAKTAIMPVHLWLPSAMAAPIPVSGLLHAVAVVKSGLLLLLKITVYIYGIDYLSTISKFLGNINFFSVLCSLSVLFSAIIALYQTNIKKLLAYSTINNMSICVLAALMFSIAGIKAAIFHMIGHAISKLSLFFASGILEYKYGITNINDLKGLNNKSKTLSFIFALATISMIGLPPLAGFIGKAYVFYAIVGNKIDYFALSILTISVLMSASYFMPLIYNIYFANNQNSSLKIIHQKSHFETIMKWTTILGCICIVFYVFLFPVLLKFLDKIQFGINF